jgi:hypothetical protein
MPIRGGTSDKLGNRYELLWAFDQLLKILDGRAIDFTLEPINSEESQGIEFKVTNADGTVDYWSVKRQTTQAGWTLALLTANDNRGRSIFGDLVAHVQRSEANHGVFASTLGAGELEELRLYIADETLFKDRLEKSAALNGKFRTSILPLFDGDEEGARQLLARIRSHAADEAQLRDRVQDMIRRLLYDASGGQLDVGKVWALLEALLLRKIHTPIDRSVILAELEGHSIRLRDWAVEKTVRAQIEQLCESYVTPIKEELINGIFLALGGLDEILADDGIPKSRKTLIVGGAGGGKSTTLGHVVESLQRSKVPVVPVRFDQLPDGILTTGELGRKLSLPESPALVLAGIAAGADCVLVIDQLDAISMASGRRVELWSLFESLRREAERFPNMALVVGCREFDLEHDQRMRAMKSSQSGFSLISLRAFSPEIVDAILQKAGLDITRVQPEIKTVLTLPLHMSMFLHLSPEAQFALHDRDGLFDSFWTEVERKANRRAERTVSWTPIIDTLTSWLSAHQRLSAPRDVLDDFSADAAVLTSERVLILSDGQYRFFHEAFFDYAFARRFASQGKGLVGFLLAGEQDLFRRAQVRQILSYARSHNRPHYLRELRSTLIDARIRFHIKSLVLQWLSSLPQPTVDEWKILKDTQEACPRLASHIRGAILGSAGWFDALDATRYFDETFSSGDLAKEQESIGCFSFPPLLKQRSVRIANLLNQYRTNDDRWNEYIQTVCRSGEFYHDRRMFDLFLDLLKSGVIGVPAQNGAVGGDWWHLMYSISKEHPELASEAIGVWINSLYLNWLQSSNELSERSSDQLSGHHPLSDQLNHSGDGIAVIGEAGHAPFAYATFLLPTVAEIIRTTSKETEGQLDNDPIWSFRSFGDDALQNDDILFSRLAQSLERLAVDSREQLDSLLAPYYQRPHNAIAYLVLRAWSANPDLYTERLVDFLVEDPRRLKIGYAIWGGGGSAEDYVSLQAVRVSSPRCSAEKFIALERVVLALRDRWESSHPPSRGWRQLRLLRALDQSRLSENGRNKLAELERKFPEADEESPVSMGSQTSWVGPPITEDAQSKMTDDQWMGAMLKYQGRDFSARYPLAGGELELARSLEQRTFGSPKRFAALAQQMPDDLPASYFEAILRGVAESGYKDPSLRDPALATTLIQRIHSLPSRPCGRAIAWLIQRWEKTLWGNEVVDIVAWYALNDLDPETDVWKTGLGDGTPHYGGDAVTAGMNCARGAAAEAIATILFSNPSSVPCLEAAIDAVSHDRVTAVRAVSIQALLALMNVNPKKAIQWFSEAIDGAPELFSTMFFERFVFYAGYRDYEGIRPVIRLMMESRVPTVAIAGARQACLHGLTLKDAAQDAENACSGGAPLREGAAGTYARDVAHKEVGPSCRAKLKQFFFDPVDAVRLKAASAFQHLSELTTSEQADLLQSFLESRPKIGELWLVLRFLQDSPVQLPDLILNLAKLCVAGNDDDPSQGRRHGASMELSKIIVRLLVQTEDSRVRAQCLDLIDTMEEHHFIGLSTELQRADR